MICHRSFGGRVPDGSRVMTMYSTIYGTCTALWPWGGEGDPYIGHNLLPPANWQNLARHHCYCGQFRTTDYGSGQVPVC